MRLAFMGTPDFAVHALDALAAAGHEIAAVYTQPPRPAGRGGAPRPTPVALAGERLGLEVRSPLNFRDPEDRAAFAALDLDAAIVVAYGLILPQAVLSAPRLGCLNAHASLLPRWRGAAPIQRAIMAGDAETGVCVMGMEAGLDTGPVFARAATPIAPDETAETLHDRLAGIAAKLLVATLPQVADGAAPEPQDADGAIYAPKIDKAEARIDWTRPAAEVDRAIRGLSPFPGAWFERDGARIKALLSQVEAGAGAPGEALDDAGLIACGEGAVRLLRLQKAGRGPLPATDFLRGTPLAAGTSLG